MAGINLPPVRPPLAPQRPATQSDLVTIFLLINCEDRAIRPLKYALAFCAMHLIIDLCKLFPNPDKCQFLPASRTLLGLTASVLLLPLLCQSA
jgi:hypothetical protein